MVVNNKIKNALKLCLACFALGSCGLAAVKNERAYKIIGNEIIYDGQIFSVLSDGLIAVRPENKAESDYQFDLANSDAPEFDVSFENDQLSILTDYVKLTYETGGDRIIDSLSMSFKKGADKIETELNQLDRKNLGGIVKSVDRADGRRQHEGYNAKSKAHPLPKTHGLLSGRGWTVLKDVGDRLYHLDANSLAAEEYFIFAYGEDYRSALKNFVGLNQRVPLLPKWSFGTWYSRYQPLSAQDYKDVVTRFRAEKMPIDVVVPDMNWHIDGWFGMRYDLEKFPDMNEFFQWTEDRGIRVGFNHHPGAIHRDDKRVYEFIERLGWSVEEAERSTQEWYERSGDKKLLPTFGYGENNKQGIEIFFDMFLSPIMKDGMDFNWVDGSPNVEIVGTYYELAEKQTKERPLVLTRQEVGSFDHHKYPIGFSGDTFITWESLKYNTEMTVTGSNVGVYWSHDIGGHMVRFNDMDHTELFARWVQSGAMSPITRLHATGGVEWDNRKAHIRKPWAWGEEVLSLTRDMLQLKYKLMPYIYSLNRTAYDEGLLMTYGMYMDYPDRTNAYKYANSQYMFGPSILVAPITEPAANGEGIKGDGFKNLWVPDGIWYDYFSGDVLEGPAETLVSKPINEMPIYIKAGAIIPMAPYMEHTGQNPLDELTVEFYQPKQAMKNNFNLYEDDGISLDYKNNHYRRTSIEYIYDPVKGTKIKIMPVEGAYSAGVTERAYKFIVKHTGGEPSALKLNGKQLPAHQWIYKNETLEINVKKVSVSKKIEVEIH